MENAKGIGGNRKSPLIQNWLNDISADWGNPWFMNLGNF